MKKEQPIPAYKSNPAFAAFASHVTNYCDVDAVYNDRQAIVDRKNACRAVTMQKDARIRFLFEKMMALPGSVAELEKELSSGGYSREELSKAAALFLSECFDEEYRDITPQMQGSNRDPVLNTSLHSAYLFGLVKLLLPYGLDPNFNDENDNLLQGVCYLGNEHIGADTLRLLLDHGGDPDLTVEGQSVFERLSDDLRFDATVLPNRPLYNAMFHAWLVLLSFRKKPYPIRLFPRFPDGKPTDLADFREHRNYSCCLQPTESGVSLCIFDRTTCWQVAQVDWKKEE